MTSVNIYDAKTHLSRLIKRVRAGEEITIADAGRPVARLVPIEPPRAPRVLGGDRGTIWAADDAFAPLAGDELAAWEGPLEPAAVPAKRPARPAPKARPTRRRSR